MYTGYTKRIIIVMNNDVEFLSKLLDPGSTISGPWRLTVWVRDGGKCPCYLFSEEHHNSGSCPDQEGISEVIKRVLNNTRHVHVFIEHFVHAEKLDTATTTKSEEQACSAKSENILNNMRNCLEVLRVNRPDEKKRIHFVDPRVDIVSVLPDGKLYEAISYYTNHLVASGDCNGALLTVYEAFIHPLLSVVPSKSFGIEGRMTGVMERHVKMMTLQQEKVFMRLWKRDIIGKIKVLSDGYTAMEKRKCVFNLENFKSKYTDMVNKFMDMCLLAQFFLAENSGMTGSIIYAGSLHSLNFEGYLKEYGYVMSRTHENKDLSACIRF